MIVNSCYLLVAVCVCFSLGFAVVGLSIVCAFVGKANFLGLEFFPLVLYVGLDLWIGIG